MYTIQKSLDEADDFCQDQAKSSGWNGTSGVSSIWDEYEDNFIYSLLYEERSLFIEDIIELQFKNEKFSKVLQ